MGVSVFVPLPANDLHLCKWSWGFEPLVGGVSRPSFKLFLRFIKIALVFGLFVLYYYIMDNINTSHGAEKMNQISKGNYEIRINDNLWTVHMYQSHPTQWAVNGPDFQMGEIKTKTEAVSILRQAVEIEKRTANALKYCN